VKENIKRFLEKI